MGTNQRVRSKQKASSKGKSGQIRLISGLWRGRKLPVKDLEGLRPTTDRVKETLFNWLAMDIRDAKCLDCFSGSGSLGLEALSRYASKVTLLELDKGAANQLKANLQLLGASNGEVVQTNCLNYLKQPGQGFDVVFVDPPFRKDLVNPTCELLENNQWLTDDALVYIERESELTELDLPGNWSLLKEKIAGQVVYQLYIREAKED